jgi:hypothetical protein
MPPVCPVAVFFDSAAVEAAIHQGRGDIRQRVLAFRQRGLE